MREPLRPVGDQAHAPAPGQRGTAPVYEVGRGVALADRDFKAWGWGAPDRGASETGGSVFHQSDDVAAVLP